MFSFIVVALVSKRYTVDDLASHAQALALLAHLIFFVTQALLTSRLVRKNYRTFRIGMIRDDGERSRKFSLRNTFLVWIWILGPQLALLLTTWVIISWYSDRLQAETIRAISSLVQFARFLIVGPYAVALALRVKYRGFRLQAYGFRYI